MPFQKLQILLEGPEGHIVEGRLRAEGDPGAVQGRMLGRQVMGGTLLLGFQPAEEIRFPRSIDPQPSHGRIPVGRVDQPRVGTHVADFVVDPLRGFIPSIGASQIQPGQGFPFADAQLGPCLFHPGLGCLEIPVVLQGQFDQGIQFGILESLPPGCQLFLAETRFRYSPVISRRILLSQFRPGRHLHRLGLGILLPSQCRLQHPRRQAQRQPYHHRFPPFHGHLSYPYQ